MPETRRPANEHRRHPELLIAGDFGATRKRMRAIRHNGTRQIVLERTGRAADYPSLTAFISSFLSEVGTRPDAIAIGVPGPVAQGRKTCWLSYINAPEPFDLTSLVRREGLSEIAFLNDLEAGAMALASPVARETVINLRNHRRGTWQPPSGGFCLITPGTGLGVAFGRDDGTVDPSEGGNLVASLDPSNPAERQLAAARSPWPEHHHTFDFLASGSGLETLLQATAATEQDPVERNAAQALLGEARQLPAELRGALISAAAHEPTPARAAVGAIELFGRILARCTQAALLTNLSAALVLAGTIAAANADLFTDAFITELERHPRHGRFLHDVSVQLCPNPALNLDGAESFAGKIAMPFS